MMQRFLERRLTFPPSDQTSAWHDPKGRGDIPLAPSSTWRGGNHPFEGEGMRGDAPTGPSMDPSMTLCPAGREIDLVVNGNEPGAAVRLSLGLVILRVGLRVVG